MRHRRLDEHHSNLVRRWAELEGGEWPSDEQWSVLRHDDRLEELEAPVEVEPAEGSIGLTFELPMPAISLIELEEA